MIFSFYGVEDVIIDPYFYYLLRIKSILSAEDLLGTTIEGLLDISKNQTEIWCKTQKHKN